MQTSVIVGILFKLLSRKKMQAKELAEHFEVSVRTIYRYLQVLEGAGVPLERDVGRGGGIKIMDNYRLDRTYFTKEEKLRLANSLRIAAHGYNDGISDAALDKLTALSPSDKDDEYLLMTDTLVIDSSGWNNANTYRHTISAVNEGISKSKVLKIRYNDRTGESSQRMIEPHTLVLKEGVFYLYAFCRMREDFRMFRIARIIGVNVLDEGFERRQISGAAWNSPFSSENMLTLELLANEEVLPEIEEWLNVTIGSDGKIRALAPDTIGTVRRLLSYGTEVTVLSPRSVKERLLEEAKKISYNY